jgi:hypothetical protein
LLRRISTHEAQNFTIFSLLSNTDDIYDLRLQSEAGDRKQILTDLRTDDRQRQQSAMMSKVQVVVRFRAQVAAEGVWEKQVWNVILSSLLRIHTEPTMKNPGQMNFIAQPNIVKKSNTNIFLTFSMKAESSRGLGGTFQCDI